MSPCRTAFAAFAFLAALSLCHGASFSVTGKPCLKFWYPLKNTDVGQTVPSPQATQPSSTQPTPIPTEPSTTPSSLQSSFTPSPAHPSPRRSLSSYQYTGYGTYYGAGGDANSYCKGNGFPYSAGSLPSVAVSQTILQNGEACGQCISLVGTGGGSGATPISSTPTLYVINNLCPECGTGVDIAENGDGKWNVGFNIVSCPGSGKRKSSRRRLLSSGDDTTN